MALEVFGWSEQRQDAFAVSAAEGFLPGRVVSEHRSHLQVSTPVTELSAEVSGRLRNDAVLRSDLPGVGDFVALRMPLNDGPATIESVLLRTTALIRKASGENRPQLLAANVDVVLIVTSPDGDFNLARIERLLALARDSGGTPVIVLNKADLAADVPGMTDQIASVARGVPLHVISARRRDGLDPIKRYFNNNQTVCLVGSSGVGKSTLTNELLGRETQATLPVRVHDGRGRHTTTHRQLYLRPGGGCIIDTPGMRGVESWIAAGVGGDEDEVAHQTPKSSTGDRTERRYRRARRIGR